MEVFHFPWLPKIFTMLSGEIPYDEVFHGDDSNKQGGSGEETIHIPLVAKILFLCFVVTTVIVLQNLLIGLTLDDMQVRNLKKNKVFFRTF